MHERKHVASVMQMRCFELELFAVSLRFTSRVCASREVCRAFFNEV